VGLAAGACSLYGTTKKRPGFSGCLDSLRAIIFSNEKKSDGEGRRPVEKKVREVS